MITSGELKLSLCRTGRGIRDVARQLISRRPLARLLSTFLCCIIIVIRPFSRLGGQYAFLVLALKELVFSVQENLAQQLELTVLNIMGAFLGIGFSTLAKCIASLTAPDSARSRATCAVFLVMICFFAGLVKSRLVRLQLSTRMSCFISVWLLTNDIGISSRVLPDSGNFLWVTLSAAIICLASLVIVMVLFRWSSTNFETETAATFSALHQCLSASLHRLTAGEAHIDPAAYRQLHIQLLQRSIKLNEFYSQAAFELRIGRLGLKSIRPFIGVVEHLRRELAWGMGPVKAVPHHHSPVHSSEGTIRIERPLNTEFVHAIEVPALELGHAILSAMEAVENIIQMAFHQGSYTPQITGALSGSQKEAIRAAEERLLVARDEARERLRHILTSLAMIALLQMAQEMRVALEVAYRVATLFEESSPRLWYPRLSLAWLGVPPAAVISDDNGNLVQRASGSGDMDAAVINADCDLTITETRQALAERAYTFSLDARRSSRSNGLILFSPMLNEASKPKVMRAACSWDAITSCVYVLWSSKHVLRARMWMAEIYRAFQHSSHWRHAIKNAIGVAILTFPAFMPEDSAEFYRGRKWYTRVHGQWMTIRNQHRRNLEDWLPSFVRYIGGGHLAYITAIICRTNPYGLVVMVTLFDIPMTWIITKTSITPFAVPASVTLPPIVFAKYISPSTTDSALQLAILRSLMIAAGSVPLRHKPHIGTAQQFISHSQPCMFRAQHTNNYEDRRKNLKLELQIRNSLYRLSALIQTMNDELSLLPKPLRHYRRVVTILQKTLDLMTGLRKIRENIPRKETVANVFKERREFMSCVCLTLFACQHAFRAREPLPQFLPSARHAFTNLETQVQECIRCAREEDPHAMGLSLIYAFAEQEVMKDMVDTLEELLELSGRLFGTSAWLTQESQFSRTNTREEGDHGWYSTFKWEEV
ncbi:Uncharacterized protein C26F1.08c [Grifola frondosa]|uniref:Uncharacterized protein C26F1.08c n=1 Tax=Grifola frondosa TaxID=5627 RepID=A0A1C7MFL6_GRIFR|nr:Uncharacterized protein C26F1.08c [Grifola frondosa]